VAEAVRVRWLHEVGEAVGKEDAEEIGVRWVEAFAKAKAAPKGEGFAENLKAELARQAEAREVAQLAVEGSPVEESRAALVPVARALTVIEPPKQEEATVPANETPEERAVREMNDKHAVISNLGGKCVIMEWVPSAQAEPGGAVRNLYIFDILSLIGLIGLISLIGVNRIIIETHKNLQQQQTPQTYQTYQNPMRLPTRHA
jgi:hypothetical protein